MDHILLKMTIGENDIEPFSLAIRRKQERQYEEKAASYYMNAY